MDLIRRVSATVFENKLSLLATIIVLLKTLFITQNYRYVSFGTDSARILAQIQRSIASGVLPEDASPRLLLIIIGLFESHLGNLAPQDLLFPVIISYPLISLFLVYKVAQLLYSDRFQVGAIALVYSLVMVVSPPNLSTIFSLVIFPLLLLFLFRYLANQVSIITLLIVYGAGFLTYSPLLLVVNSVFILFLLLTMTIGSRVMGAAEIRRVSLIFFLLPLVFVFFYIPDNLSVISTYRGGLLYFWRVFGLWVSKDFFMVGVYIISFYLLASCLFGSIIFLFPKVVNHLQLWIKIDAKSLQKIGRLLSKALLITVLFLALIYVEDWQNFFQSFPSVFRETPVPAQSFISQKIVGRFFSGEAWREIYLAFNLVFTLTFLTYFLGEGKRSAKMLFVLFYSVFLLVSFPKIELLNLLAGSRGIVLLTPLIALMSGALLVAVKEVKAIFLIFFSFLFFLSFGVAIYPTEPVDKKIISAAAYYRQQINSEKLLILAPYTILPSEATEKYFSMSFLPLSQSIGEYSEINIQLLTSCGVPASVISMIRKNNYKYIFVERGFSKGKLYELMRILGGKIVYQNADVYIVQIAR